MATTKITSPDLFDLGSLNTALKLPSGTTAERPTSPSTGEWRYNTTTNLVEFWDGGAWRDLQSEEIPPTPSENFNTVLYTGNGSTQSITGVGFKPDFVWVKVRSTTGSGPIADSTRGTGKALYSNLTDADYTFPAGQGVTSFDADGFSVGDDATGNGGYNGSGKTYVAWCWKANGGTTSSNTDGTNITSTVQVNAKAGFSIVQFTTPGSFSGSNTVGHGLGSTPDAIFVKRTDGVEDWYVYHQAAGLNKASRLNSTINYANATYLFGTVNSTVFNPNYTSATNLTNIAYCFKSIPGYSKFGSYTGNGTTQVVNTGFQPGWIMIKSTVGNDNWRMYDTTRGITAGGFLKADTNAAEDTADAPNFLILSNGFEITAGGTTVGNNANGNLYTYYAFAADQSAAPVLADSFAPDIYTGNGTNRVINTGFRPDFVWIKARSFARNHYLYDTIRGVNNQLNTNSTAGQANITNRLTAFNTEGFTLGTSSEVNNNSETYVAWSWKANSVPTINTDGSSQSVVSANANAGFSIVNWTGAGGNATIGHGLSSAPEMIITKRLNGVGDWYTYHKDLNGGTNPASYFIKLNSTDAEILNSSGSLFQGTSPTSTAFYVGNSLNASVSDNYIAYCFYSVSGFSKIGSYTGNGSATGPIVTTGFQPDFVMIKSRSLAGTAWVIFDSARSPSNPRQLLLQPQSAAVEQNVGNAIDFNTDNFQLTDTNDSRNKAGETYIYMAYKENTSPIVPAGYMAYLVVAGGAGGGGTVYPNKGGGGGAGGLRTSFGSTSGGGASAESNFTLSAGTYTITVGAGGGAAANGAASTITGAGSVSTVGGGQGGAITVSGTAGGSGGGSGGNNGGSITGGAGTAGEGFAGGTTTGNAGYDGSGGGGAAQVGGNGGFRNSTGGVGGNGLAVSITGTSTYYAGGGGGGSDATPGGRAGGLGGGGAGGDLFVDGGNGTANLGGGAGAGGEDAQPGSGGSGVVILRLRTSEYTGTTTGSPTVTTTGEETVLTFTGSGTYVHS